MLSQKLVFRESKNFTSHREYECPQLSLLIITLSSTKPTKRTEILSYYSMLMIHSNHACVEHSDFLKVNVASATAEPVKARRENQQKAERARSTAHQKTLWTQLVPIRAQHVQLRAF